MAVYGAAARVARFKLEHASQAHPTAFDEG